MSAATLSTSVLSAAPGADAGCDVHLTNPTTDVLTLHVEVDGPAAEWAVVLPAALVLPPRGSGRARITFSVPHCEGLAGSTRPFVVWVTGRPAVKLAGRIEVTEVQDLRVSIRPLMARARGATTHTVTVENRGTLPSRAMLVAGETAGNLRVNLVEDRVTVAPGDQARVEVSVAPRRRFLTGRSRAHPFTIEARPERGSPVTAAATRFQEPRRWRRGVLAAAVALAAGSAGALMVRSDRSSDGTRFPGADTAPATPVVLTSSCPAPGTGETPALDIAGFAYCPATLTVAVGAEVVWTNADLAPHTVTYDGPDGPVDSGSMVQGQSWSTRFRQPGTYGYYCRFHPGMSGTIVVDAGR